MQNEPRVRQRLPIHESNKRIVSRTHVLRVDGLVRNPLSLTLADLERLPQQALTDDFTCLEGWAVPKVRWRGVLLKTVLSMAEPLAEAHYVQVSAENFSLPLPLEHAERALLAIRLHETPIPPEHGGPVRLIVPGGQCFTSIKWLDHLKLSTEMGANTAETVAKGRLRTPERNTSTREDGLTSPRYAPRKPA